MLAAVLAARGRLELRDVPAPQPAPGEVLCRVGYAGICGSDLHAYRELTFPVGTVMGHEAVARVEAVGPGVSAARVGERVVLRPAFSCGECRYCQAGAVNLCVQHIGMSIGTGAPGAFAEYVAVRASMAVPLPDSVPDVDATLVEPLACAVHAVRRSALRLGDRIAVLGAGPIGLLVIAAARAAGASEVVAWERASRRQALAREYGADEVHGEIDGAATGEFDVVFECAGHREAPAAAAALARKGGQVVLVAMGTADAPLREFQWVVKELDVIASINCRPEEFGIALDLVRRRVLDPARMVSAVIDLERIEPEGFRALEDSTGPVKILVRPRPDAAAPVSSR